MKKKSIAMIILLLIVVLVVVACAPKEEPPVQEDEPQQPPVTQDTPDKPKAPDPNEPKEGYPLIEFWYGEKEGRLSGQQAEYLVEMVYAESATETEYIEIPSDALRIRITEAMNDMMTMWLWKADGVTYRSYYPAEDAEIYYQKETKFSGTGEYPPIYTLEEEVYDELMKWVSTYK